METSLHLTCPSCLEHPKPQLLLPSHPSLHLLFLPAVLHVSPFCTSATCTCLESSSALLLPIPLPPKEQRTASPSPLPPSAATCGDPGATGRLLLLPPPRQLSYSIGLGASSQRALGRHPVPGMYSRDIHAPAKSPPCWPWAAEHGGEEESTAGAALCCRESPARRRPAQVCYGALTSAKPTGGESKRAHNGPAKARPLCPETAPLHLRAPHPGLCRGGREQARRAQAV